MQQLPGERLVEGGDVSELSYGEGYVVLAEPDETEGRMEHVWNERRPVASWIPPRGRSPGRSLTDTNAITWRGLV
jgi:hypothetical protein